MKNIRSNQKNNFTICIGHALNYVKKDVNSFFHILTFVDTLSIAKNVVERILRMAMTNASRATWI